MNNLRVKSVLSWLILVFVLAVPNAEGYEMTGGVEVLADFSECCIPDDIKELEAIMRAAAKVSGSTDLEFIAHKFEPQGVSAVLILAESHISIHSWPEHKNAAIDIYTCGSKADPYKAIEYLKTAFKAGKVESVTVHRGKDMQKIDTKQIKKITGSSIIAQQ
jgi:S-adenosylmethionine decarboxylase